MPLLLQSVLSTGRPPVQEVSEANHAWRPIGTISQKGVWRVDLIRDLG